MGLGRKVKTRDPELPTTGDRMNVLWKPCCVTHHITFKSLRGPPRLEGLRGQRKRVGFGRETSLVYIPALSLTGFGCLGLEFLLCITGTVMTTMSQGHCENPMAEQALENNGLWRLSPGPSTSWGTLHLLSSFIKGGVSSDSLSHPAG